MICPDVIKIPLLKRMKKKSIIDPITNCWIWQGSGTGWSGYGYVHFNHRMWLVHRISAYMFHDLNLLSDEHVLHKEFCPNKKCWNPEHIYVGNAHLNALDREKAKRDAKSEC